MTIPRRYAAAAPLPDGRVLVAGGSSGGANALASAEIFDPATNTFSATGSMTTPRTRQAVAALLPDGRVLVAGGSSDFVNAIASAEVFDPATETFSAAGIGAMTVPRRYAMAAPLPDGRVLVTGGTDGAQFFASSEVFDPTTNTFSAAGVGSMSMARTRAVAAPLADGRALVVSGTLDEITIFPSSEAFDPATGAFSSAGIGPIGTPRFYAAAAPLPGGRVLIAGGIGGGAILQTAEVFVPDPIRRVRTRPGGADTGHGPPLCANEEEEGEAEEKAQVPRRSGGGLEDDDRDPAVGAALVALVGR